MSKAPLPKHSRDLTTSMDAHGDGACDMFFKPDNVFLKKMRREPRGAHRICFTSCSVLKSSVAWPSWNAKRVPSFFFLNATCTSGCTSHFVLQTQILRFEINATREAQNFQQRRATSQDGYLWDFLWEVVG